MEEKRAKIRSYQSGLHRKRDWGFLPKKSNLPNLPDSAETKMYGPRAKHCAYKKIQSILNSRKKIGYEKLIARVVTEFWLNEKTVKKLIGYAETEGKCDIEYGVVTSNCYHVKPKNKNIAEFIDSP